MSLVRFNPFREITQAQNRLNALLGDAFASGPSFDGSREGNWDFGFLPAVDIRTGADHSLVIETELPGVAREDVSVRVENRTLTLRGERKRVSQSENEVVHRSERLFGTFVRSFALPETVNVDAIKAEFKDGVLTIVLPRKEEAKPRSVDVRVG